VTGATQRGKFIVIEGIDGSGISTQVELLRMWFKAQNLPLYVTKEPTRSPIGGLIEGALRHHITFTPYVMSLLFTADRVDHVAKDIEPALASGKNVLSDRYTLSGLAYQSVDVGYDWLRVLNAPCPEPDLTIFLDVPVEVSVERASGDAHRDRTELYEQESTLERVRASFLDIIDAMRLEGHDIETVDATGSPLEVARRISRIVATLFRGTEPELPENVLQGLRVIHGGE